MEPSQFHRRPRSCALRDKLLKGLQVCFLPGLIPVSVSTETPGLGIDFGQVGRQIAELVGYRLFFRRGHSRDRVTGE